MDPENKSKAANPTEVARETLRQLALRRIAPTPDNYRRLYYEITDTPDSAPAAAALARGASQDESANLKLLKELLAKTLEYAVASNLEHDPRLAERARSLIARIGQASSSGELKKIAAELKKLWLDIELHCANQASQQEMLKRLLNLLMENIGELLDDDTWLRGQLDTVREVINGPLHPRALLEAEQRIKEIIFKQGLVKHGLREATAMLKTTMKTFVGRLGAAVAATGEFQEKISGYAERISRTDDVHELQQILDGIMQETRTSEVSSRDSYDALMLDREIVERAEERIRELEERLAKMSALVREDPMTQSLNRRGMEDELKREIERSNRYGTTFCVVVIDVDNFKQLNDTYGHQTGDQALIHLVNVAKQELRMLDQVARVGGEEFLIVLPSTHAEEAGRVVERLQRVLTRKFFLNNNDRILITFSAGVAQHIPGEPQNELFHRADEAMYEAKKTGKNRVCLAGGREG